jgi:predicted signal transduction protein with EAL and GGDEF domain
MAARVLRIVGQTPIACGTESLRITASIGYARFPLAPYDTQGPWEQALNLADMALYTAKNQGRNRAVGIASTTAPTSEALREIGADFERAWRDSRVTLTHTSGPESREPVRAAAA